MAEQTKFILDEEEIPKRWYNVLADLRNPLDPPIHPATHEPVEPEALLALFPKTCVEQEVSQDRWIDIPEPVRDVYRLYRPTPLIRARRLEAALETPAHIYYKYEGYSPPGSHKPNTAIAQAYYNQQEGIKRLATETGAGQWGSALSFGCQLFGLDCTVYMVKVSYHQKPYRRSMMEVWGAEVIPSPSDRTDAGKHVLAEDPDSPGSLGIAISEAIEDAVKHDGVKYSLGSVLNHVLLHQTVVGLEAKQQFEMASDYPDVLIGCIGGGSNFSGFFLPFLKDVYHEGRTIDIVAVEPTACPSVTKGEFRYDFGDTAETTPLIKMHTLGHDFVPPGIHAGGLRYHGMAPIICRLAEDGDIRAVALPQNAVFEGAVLFAQAEGIIPAPESNHAVRFAIDEARRCRETGEAKVIAFNLSGHGHFDMGAYDEYLAGKLEDYDYPEEKVRESLAKVPKI
ncbi:MAG: TrpB-like pyridoxal phosphate-dependent enzyme [Candidatus Bipolaricaulia bacterium]